MAHPDIEEKADPTPQAEIRSLPGITPTARLMDRVGRWVIAVGGIGVIAVVLGIFVFVLREAYPLFLNPEAEAVGTWDASGGGQALGVGAGPYREVGYVVRAEGIDFIDLASGAVLRQERPGALAGRRIVSVYRSPVDGYLGLGTDEGSVVAARVTFSVGYTGGARVVTPELSVEGEVRLDGGGDAVVRVAYRNDGAWRATVVGVTASGRLVTAAVVQKRGLLGGGRREVFVYDLTEEIAGRPTAVLTDGRGQTVLAGTDRGEIFRWDVSGPRTRPRRTQRFQAAEAGQAITALEFLLGDVSVVVGDGAGRVSTWFPVRQSGRPGFQGYQKIHAFEPHQGAVTAIAPSERDKQFLTGDAAGNLALHHMTSEQTFFRMPAGGTGISAVVFAPKADGFLGLDGGGRLVHYRLHNPHPEVTLKTLFGEVWYEGYEGPAHVWQSTGGTDEFEPKLSIVPLVFGTAKGTLYAMLFALPLAVLAAIYTSEFARPEIRNAVKPTVELMASLPSVILGFLAGLWMAPLLERGVVGALLLFPAVPAVVVLAAWVFKRLPGRAVRWLPDQGEIYLLVPVTALAAWLAFVMGPEVERVLFGGNFQRWLMQTSDTRYDQRNCLVVGFAMGFAVVPIIYTICEDALSSVPSHLRGGSLALGATPWQTALRVVLPTASPGIFSAAMIGFGRAVGETMIVLMATGNTPIMDWSIFNGMRTLSANIAVEIPEAPHEGTLYRVLFLTGLLLAGVTFLVNTAAEIVRQRLRERYSRI